MEKTRSEGAEKTAKNQGYYCPACRRAVDRPLVCGDCLAVICRDCGTPLERADELGLG